jgi:DUF438 domain-containing protein
MEPIRNNTQRFSTMVEYLRLLYHGPVTKEVFESYRELLHSASAYEANEALDEVLKDAEDIDSWKIPVARYVRSVSKGLDSEILPEYPAGSLFADLENENTLIEAELNALQALLLHPRPEKGEGDSLSGGRRQQSRKRFEDIRKRVGDFSLLKAHYQRLQNELFPLFEQASSRHRCVSLMWSLQDDVLALQARLAQTPAIDHEDAGVSFLDRAEADSGDEAVRTRFWNELGAFYVTAGMLLYRERRILYPVAFRALPERLSSTAHNAKTDAGTYGFSTLTGSLGTKELEAVFKNLPLDISFIGSDDRVKFYSDPPRRIFPRSPAVVGRLVQNCHPPKSVAAVEEILRSFKNGERDSAEFWLQSRGAFIHIQYFALRDAAGTYLGTMEVSQDASHVRSLEGEKRLL